MKFLEIIILASFLVMLFGSGCSTNLKDHEKKIIQEYLDYNVLTPGFGGQMYSSFRVLKRDNEKIYIWAQIQEYYSGGTGTGISLPITLVLAESNGELKIATHQAPRTGYFAEDLARIFPKSLHNKINTFPENLDIMKQLREECEQRWQQSMNDL